MQENKYFYKNIPLPKYCQENNLNLNSIRTRIWKTKNNKKYENYTDQEIIKMVIEKYEVKEIYMYKGLTLRQYCIQNNIEYRTIYSRIKNLKKENPNLSPNELVIKSIENFENKNFTLFYKGETLLEYCEKQPDLEYQKIKNFIVRESKKNPNLSTEEMVEIYLNKEHKGIHKYYYCGIPLIYYSEENGLSYKNIIAYIHRHKDEEKYQNISDDTFIEMIMEQYQPFEPKYMYEGVTLRQYCEQNDLSYYSVVSFVKRKLVKNNNLNIDDLIEEGVKTINRCGIIYYYNGIPLKDYCLENNLNASSIRASIIRKKVFSDIPLQEIVNHCVESYQKFSIKYYYNGEPLVSYCKKVGLNYSTIISSYIQNYSLSKNVDEAIKEIVDYYLQNPPKRYYFGDMTLAQFCNINGYAYSSIYQKIKVFARRGELTDTEQIIKESIKKYEEKLEIKKINEIFEQIKLGKIDNIKEICDFLKINCENVMDLIDMNFSYNKAINMIWYFSDKKDNFGYKLITDNKIEQLFSLVYKVSKADEKNIDNFEFYDLIGIYKSELYDSKNQILLREKKYICKIINSLCSNYGIKIDKNNYEDFESELKLYFIILIDKLHVNKIGQIIKYIDLTIKGYFRKYLKNYKRENAKFSLDESKFDKDGKPMILDTIKDPTNQYEELENTSFSSNMMEVLSSLTKEDLNFVILKFQENFSDYELSEYFNISIEEVRKKEISILSTLKNNDNIKVMKKTKKD